MLSLYGGSLTNYAFSCFNYATGFIAISILLRSLLNCLPYNFEPEHFSMETSEEEKSFKDFKFNLKYRKVNPFFNKYLSKHYEMVPIPFVSLKL